MSSTSGNPFIFPGMGLGNTPGETSGNPILQSMEMMRQAWAGLGGSTPFGSALPANPILNPEELDRRIQELNAVASWLRLNLNMVQGSIQALEVQRATLATLRSFASMGAGMAQSGEHPPSGPSPLDIALAAKPGRRNHPEAPPQANEDNTEPPPDTAAAADATAQAPSAQQAWWNLLQNQFNQIAQAAAATLPSTSTSTPTDKPARKPAAQSTAASRKAAPRKAARKSTPRKSG
ncbi:transcriptional regulator [Verticiella sediminum]|uniref:Transcriptional regulator n=1 Tax=Verticiella sediminum TaxID=1247510 RepID=A0A556AKE3_9BURK|nr:PhaM family polyhydroxyalkanoate granule multifunctional regulatory protein [Verticiella sediminum]TSH93340.1 transcriptional regulator [Verticiella sediminum]